MNYEEFLLQLLANDQRYMVLTSENRGPMRNLPAKAPAQFLDTGIAEQTMLGMAAGLALRGRRPIVHALATFLTMRAFEFIRTDVGLGNLPVIVMGTLAGFLSDGNGPTHQSLEDIALMRGIPNMRVFCPADEADLLDGLTTITKTDSPWYVRYNATPAQAQHAPFAIGKAETFGDGTDVAICCYGFLFRQVLEAKMLLEQQGVSVRVLNMRTLKPVDEQAVVDAARSRRLLVTVEDHFQTGGLYSILADVLLRQKITANVLPLALNERWFAPALLPVVLEHEGFTGQQIAAKILQQL